MFVLRLIKSLFKLRKRRREVALKGKVGWVRIENEE